MAKQVSIFWFQVASSIYEIKAEDDALLWEPLKSVKPKYLTLFTITQSDRAIEMLSLAIIGMV